MTVAPFDYTAWLLRYPEFTTIVPEPLAVQYFAEAGLYLNNTDGSKVACDPVTFQPRQMLLYMLTAHIAALFNPTASPLVGRINNASEGSVSVQTELGQMPLRDWFAQTKYGFAYWQATARYRTMRYRPMVVAAPNPIFP